MSVEQMCSTYDKDVSKYNYMISPSALYNESFSNFFPNQSTRLIETGYPRNDFIIESTKRMIYMKLNQN